MTFADKYEILEAVGRGRVETFVARKVSTDQRVLVYVFEGREQGPEEPTVQWVLESFRALAPSPPELVVETGRYNGTSYAYLVTKLPDRAALQNWLRSYEAQPEATGQPEAPLESMPLANAIHTGRAEFAQRNSDKRPAHAVAGCRSAGRDHRRCLRRCAQSLSRRLTRQPFNLRKA